MGNISCSNPKCDFTGYSKSLLKINKKCPICNNLLKYSDIDNNIEEIEKELGNPFKKNKFKIKIKGLELSFREITCAEYDTCYEMSLTYDESKKEKVYVLDSDAFAISILSCGLDIDYSINKKIEYMKNNFSKEQISFLFEKYKKYIEDFYREDGIEKNIKKTERKM